MIKTLAKKTVNHVAPCRRPVRAASGPGQRRPAGRTRMIVPSPAPRGHPTWSSAPNNLQMPDGSGDLGKSRRHPIYLLSHDQQNHAHCAVDSRPTAQESPLEGCIATPKTGRITEHIGEGSRA
eukprot:874378-Pyramimonas_sp.AAC.1